MKRTVRFLPLTLALLAGASAHAKPLPNFDAAPSAAPALGRSFSAVGSASVTVASIEEKRGVPSFVWVEPPPSAGLASRMMTEPAEAIARRFIEGNAALYGLSRPALDAVVVRHIHDTGTGGIIV